MIELAWRNFSRSLDRYRVIIAALSVAVIVLVLLIGIIQGMSQTVREKSARYFAGHISVAAYLGSAAWYFPEPDQAVAAVRSAVPRDATVVRRNVYHGSDATLFFGGSYIRQRRLIGVDWRQESKILADMAIVEGRVPEAGDAEAIVLSTATAEAIGARVGDEVILSLRTRAHQANTARLVVRAIFDEESFFGYTAYMLRETLNLSIGWFPDAVGEIGVHLPNYSRLSTVTKRLHDRLSQEFATVPLADSRAERNRSLTGSDLLGSVMPLTANLEELRDLLDGLQLVALVVVGLFLLVVVIGVSNTFLMVTQERTREIATLRALGMGRARTIVTLATEAAITTLVCLAIGLPVGLLVLQLAHSLIQLPSDGWTSIFLVAGRIPWHVPGEWFGWITLTIVGASILGILRPAARATGIDPVEGLRDA